MNIAVFLVYVSIFVWLFPIARQWGGRFFLFFLILGLSDPIALMVVKIFSKDPDIVHSIAAILLYQSLSIKNGKKLELRALDYIIGVFSIGLIPVVSDLNYLTAALHILILLRIINIFILKIYHKSELNIFIMVLLFYEITTVIKLSVFISGTQVSYYYFYLTLFFQLIIGLFFIFFNEDSNSIRVKLQT